MARVLPSLATVLCWYNCDHLAPVFEEDILSSVISVQGSREAGTGRILDLNIEVFADRGKQAPEKENNVKVLDWDLAVLAGAD